MGYDIAIEVDREEDGRWIADAVSLPGVVAYGQTREEAISRVEAIALRVLADKIETEQPAGDIKFCLAIA